MAEAATINVLLAGQKWFGAEVFLALSALEGVSIAAVSAPVNGLDRLAALADCRCIKFIPAGTLNAATMPSGVDLIVAAHSHDFIGEKTRLKARWGGIGYHPSLLPLHRGRDAVRWVIRMKEPVTGGTVYRLSNRMDGGPILDQRLVFIRPGATAESLWREQLGPLGVAMVQEVVLRFARHGFQPGAPQDESLATWEPAIDRPPAFRPDLTLIPRYLGSESEETLADVVANAAGGFSASARPLQRRHAS